MEGEEAAPTPLYDPLTTGIVEGGCASDLTGTAYCDDTEGYAEGNGPNYGDGVRYERKEARFITKIPGKHDRNGNLRQR